MTTSRASALLATLAFTAACSSGDQSSGRVETEAGGAVLPAVVADAPGAEPSAEAQARTAIRLTVAGGKNEARYRVRERLMGKDLDNDAVGVTSDVTGGLSIDSTGAPIAGASRFTVRLTGLTSDNGRRDGYVQRRLLETEAHPEVTFVPTAVRGLSAAAVRTTDATPRTFQLVGDLTVKGVTRPSTWQVTAKREGGNVVGSAITRFTFAEFGLTQPRVPVVLSVSDTITLEYDFTLSPAAAGGR